MTIQEKDYKWYKDNYEDLSRLYKNRYIAIKNKKVLGDYSTFSEGVLATKASEEMGTFIVQFCNGNESGYTGYITSIGLVV